MQRVYSSAVEVETKKEERDGNQQLGSSLTLGMENRTEIFFWLSFARRKNDGTFFKNSHIITIFEVDRLIGLLFIVWLLILGNLTTTKSPEAMAGNDERRGPLTAPTFKRRNTNASERKKKLKMAGVKPSKDTRPKSGVNID